MISPSDSQVAARAAEYVRLHPGCIQSNVIEHIMRGRSYGWATRRAHGAVATGGVVARRADAWLRPGARCAIGTGGSVPRRNGNLLSLYPPGPGWQEAGRDG